MNKYGLMILIVIFFTTSVLAAEEPANKKILIVIGSVTESVKTKSGGIDAVTSATKRMGDSTGESTMEIGFKMREYLEGKGYAVDVMRAEDPTPDIVKYDLVVIGSSIEGGISKASVKVFIDANRQILNEKKVAVFAVCASKSSNYKKMREISQTYPDKVANGLVPVSEGIFAGKIPDMGCCLNFIGWRLVLGTKVGDNRDWAEIEKWTLSLAEDGTHAETEHDQK